MEKKSKKTEDILSVDNLLATLGPAVLKSIRDHFAILSPEFRCLWANSAMMAIHMYDGEDVTGKICYEVFKGADAPCPECPIQSTIESGRTRIKEMWVDFPDGKRRWGEVRAYPVRGERRTVVAVIVIVIETTTRKEDLDKHKEYAAFLSKKLNENSGQDKQIHFDDGDITLNVNLSGRETEVLRLLTEGYTNSQISELLSVSPNTVKTHINNIFNKLGVNDRTQAAVLATRHDLI
ncbi:LuxR C-terminal-related transcriptional regulator [Thermodesulfobacteriota bacterium]